MENRTFDENLKSYLNEFSKEQWLHLTKFYRRARKRAKTLEEKMALAAYGAICAAGYILKAVKQRRHYDPGARENNLPKIL